MRAWLSYMRCRMANTRLPLVNVGMQITKKYFRNFNFNFNYRELLSKSATFSLRSFGVVPNTPYTGRYKFALPKNYYILAATLYKIY